MLKKRAGSSLPGIALVTMQKVLSVVVRGRLLLSTLLLSAHSCSSRTGDHLALHLAHWQHFNRPRLSKIQPMGWSWPASSGLWHSPHGQKFGNGMCGCSISCHGSQSRSSHHLFRCQISSPIGNPAGQMMHLRAPDETWRLTVGKSWGVWHPCSRLRHPKGSWALCTCPEQLTV